MPPKTPTSLAPPPPATSGAAPKGLRRLVLEYGKPRLAALPTSKERIIDFFKTIVWVIPLTLLIWIYADRDQYFIDPELVSCPIQLQTTSERAVWVPDQPGQSRQTSLKIRLEGPHSGVLKVRSEISKARSGQPLVQISLGADYDPPEYQDYTLEKENLRDLVNNNPVFIDNGVTVKEFLPDKIKVHVEKMVSSRLLINPLLPDNVTVQGPVNFDPPQVMVRAPAFYFKEDDQRLIADLTKFPELQQKDGSHTLNGVPLTAPYANKYNDNLSFIPTTVTAQISTSLRISEWTIRSLPVDVVMSAGLETKYVVQSPESDFSVFNVKVRGPSLDIDKLERTVNSPKPDQQQPRALLYIRAEDTPDKDIPRPVHFEFPAGITPVGEYRVTFRLSPRNAEAP
jgi:hypothetical protein